MNLNKVIELAKSRKDGKYASFYAPSKKENILTSNNSDMLEKLSEELRPEQENEVTSLIRSLLSHPEPVKLEKITTGSMFNDNSSAKTVSYGKSTADTGDNDVEDEFKTMFLDVADKLIKYTETFEERSKTIKKPLTIEETDLEGKMIQEEEMIVLGNRGKSTMFNSLIKLNNLPPRQSVDIEKYMNMGEFSERLEMNFMLFKTLGGPKKSANQGIIRGNEGKKIGLQNKTVITQRANLFGQIKLAKVMNQEIVVYGDYTSIDLFFAPSKFEFTETSKKNLKFSSKNRMSLMSTSMSNKSSHDIEDGLNEKLDFGLMNQFPIHIPFKFERLGFYSKFFLKKFVSKFIVNWYITDIKQQNVKPFDELSFSLIALITNEKMVENHNERVRESSIIDIEESILSRRNMKKKSYLNFKLMKFPHHEEKRKDDLIMKFTLKTALSQDREPVVRLKANKYNKGKQSSSKKYVFRITIEYLPFLSFGYFGSTIVHRPQMGLWI